MYVPPWRWAQQYGLLSVDIWGEGEGVEQDQENREEPSQGGVYSSPCSSALPRRATASHVWPLQLKEPKSNTIKTLFP